MTANPPKIEGVWQMVRAELAGEQAPEMVVKHTQLELRNNRYAVRYSGEVVVRGSYSLVSESTVILKGEIGTNAGRQIPCILRLRGSRLQICYGLDEIIPTEFSATAGTNRYLATYCLTPNLG